MLSTRFRCCDVAIADHSSRPPVRGRPLRTSARLPYMVQIGLPVKNYIIKRIPYRLDRKAFHMAGAAAYFRPSLARSNWPLRIRCVNSMPEIVIAVPFPDVYVVAASYCFFDQRAFACTCNVSEQESLHLLVTTGERGTAQKRSRRTREAAKAVRCRCARL